MSNLFSIGIDVGGTNTDIGLVNEIGVCIDRQNLKTAAYYEATKYAEDIVGAVKLLLSDNHIDTITGIGIGAPCVNYHEQVIDSASNLNMKGKIHLKSLINNYIDVPVLLTNDANAAAQGEMIYGGAKQMKNFIMITLGTGVGSGIMIDGKIVYGYDGFAGELGHAILYPDGRECPCGRRGCLEQYVSIRGIIQTCKELAPHYPHNELALLPENMLDCKTIADAAHRGNPLAVEVYKITGYRLGIAMANAVAFSSPEAFFLMGGPVKAGNVLLNPLRESFQKHKLFVYKHNIPILISSLNENDAAILGAASLTRQTC